MKRQVGETSPGELCNETQEEETSYCDALHELLHHNYV